MKQLQFFTLKFILIITISFNNVFNIQANELDTLYKHPYNIDNTNYSISPYASGNPQYDWGFRYGHNPTGQDGFGERYEVSEKSEIVNILVFLAWGQYIGTEFPDSHISDDHATFSIYELSTVAPFENLPKATPIASKTIPYKDLINGLLTYEFNVVTFDPPVIVEGEFFVVFELSAYKSGTVYEDDDLIGLFMPDVTPQNVTDKTTTAIRYSGNGSFMYNWHPAYGAYTEDVYFPVYPVIQEHDDNPPVSTGSFVASGDFKLYKAYPNPVTGNILNIEFETATSSDIVVSVHNINGQRISKTVFPSNDIAGKQKVSIDVSELSNGSYFYTVQSGHRVLPGRFIK